MPLHPLLLRTMRVVLFVLPFLIIGKRNAFAAIVSAEFEIARGGVVTYKGDQALAACVSDTECITVWKRDTGEFVATRIGATGSLDRIPVDLPGVGGSAAILVARKNVEYLLATDSYDYADYVYVRTVYRLDATTLAVIGAPYTIPHDSSLYSLDGLVGLVSHTRGSTGIDIALLEPNGDLSNLQTNAVEDFCAPDITFCAERVSLARGAGYIAMAWQGKLRRFSEVDLSPIDAIANTTNTVQAGSPRIAFDGANFVLAWPSFKTVRLSRVRASDGVVLDPDDTFNNLPGSLLLATEVYDNVARVSVFPHQPGEVVVHYTTNSNHSTPLIAMHALRVTTTGAKAVAGGNLGFQSRWIEGSIAAQYGVAWAGHWGVSTVAGRTSSGTSTAKTVTGTIFQPGVGNAMSAGALFDISTGHSSLSPPVLVSDGTNFLVAWVEGSDLLGVRIRGFDGKILDSPPRTLLHDARGQNLTAAWSGSGYVFAWGGVNTGSVYLVGTDVSGNETWRRSLSLYPYTLYQIALGCDGERCAIVYTNNDPQPTCKFVWGRRISSAGAWLDANSSVFRSCDGYQTYDVGVAGNSSRPSTYRTFMTTWAARRDLEIRSARYRAESGALINNDSGLSGSSAFLQSDGERFLVGWHTNGVLNVQGIDDVEGTLFPGSPVAVADPSVDYRGGVAASHDGTQYALAWRTAGGEVRAQYVDSDANLSGSPVDVASGVHASNAKIASNSYGRSLMTFQRPYPPPSTNPGARVLGAFLDNELGPGMPEPEPGDDGGAPSDAGADADEDPLDGGTEPEVDAGDEPFDGGTEPDVDAGENPFDSGAESDADWGEPQTDAATPEPGEDASDGENTVDAGDVSDAGAPVDASSEAGEDPPSRDASIGDSGSDDAPLADPEAEASSDAAGCSCRMTGAAVESPGAGLLFLLAALAQVRGTRRKRRS